MRSPVSNHLVTESGFERIERHRELRGSITPSLVVEWSFIEEHSLLPISREVSQTQRYGPESNSSPHTVIKESGDSR